jgi:hypothetical protein
MTELSLETLVNQIAAATAESASRYIEASGLEPRWDMPEHVMAAGVLYDPSRTFSITLETSVPKLMHWTKVTDAPAEFADMVRQRVDLVVFRRTGDDRKDDEPFALVEFKRHNILESERSKVIRIGELVPAFRYGVVCSVVNVGEDSDWLRREKTKASENYGGFVAQVAILPPVPLPDPYAVFAHGFQLKR